MNLWADFDNNHLQSPDSAVHGRIHYTRRITDQVVLSSLRDWLLHDYAAAYCRSLAATRIFRRCYWIDALGIDTKANAIPVSPVEEEQEQTKRTGKKRKKGAAQADLPPAVQPIARLAHTLTQEGSAITLYGLVLEAGSSKRKEVRAYQNGTVTTAKDVIIPKESGIVRGSWLEVAPMLLKEIEQVPAIFLLNPLGHTPFSHDDLALLYSRTVPTELCLLVAHKQVAARLQAARRDPAQAPLLTGLLRSDRWKTLPDGEDAAALAVRGFIDLFTASMKRYFLLPIQCIQLPMHVGLAAVENVPYTLLFATRRQDSLISMNDSLCLYRRRIYEQSHRGVLGEEWFAAQQQERYESALQQLYQHTLQQGRAQRVRRWPELRQQLLLAHFGQFTIREYDATLQRLLANNEVRCEWRRVRAPSGEEEESRLPGNDDTLIWK